MVWKQKFGAITWIALLGGIIWGNFAFGQMSIANSQTITIIPRNNAKPYKVIQDLSIYAEKWDKLAQPLFWQQILSMNPELAIVNVAETRRTLNIIYSADYDSLETEAKIAFKDSIRELYQVADHHKIYVTSGKKDYYQLTSAVQLIGPAIDIFKRVGTNPWYAQAILLIESPGKQRTSAAGASGYFQLMKSVARAQGLIVNKEIDERHDFNKSAEATAKFIKTVCIPEAKTILALRGISYNESDLWFRLLVMHVYHAGSRNVANAVDATGIKYGGMGLIRKMWQTEIKGFKNASQNYSQIILASLLELDRIIYKACDVICPAIPEPDENKRLSAYQEITNQIGQFFYQVRKQSMALLAESPFFQSQSIDLIDQHSCLPDPIGIIEED